MVGSRKILVVIVLIGVSALFGGLAIDASGDGLRVYEDVIHQSDPFKADTDGDRLTDYEEVHKHGTDPADTDTDNDRLSDYEEVHEYGSSPTNPRTTGSLPDGKEVYEYSMDPAKSDTDGDGLADHAEVMDHDTDPNKPDTDDDNLTDTEEVTDHETDPTNSDTDGDGLLDDEVQEYGTDPLLEDSRGTGLSDAQAVQILDDPTSDPSLNEKSVKSIFEQNSRLHLDRPISDSSVSNTGVDSSGDGFSDAFSKQEENLTANEIDIFVQVTYGETHDIPVSSLLLVQQAFDDAPVTNVAGEEVGINLHFYVNQEAVGKEQYSVIESSSYANGYYDYLFTAQNYGFYHAIVTDTVINSQNPTSPTSRTSGITHSNTDGVIVEEQDTAPRQAAILMHELGHQLGLWSDLYEGIDSRELSYEKYPSVMNYWGRDTVDYSDGPGFNDWEYIAEHIHENHPQTWAVGGSS